VESQGIQLPYTISSMSVKTGLGSTYISQKCWNDIKDLCFTFHWDEKEIPA
jgi:hypothetical protein